MKKIIACVFFLFVILNTSFAQPCKGAFLGSKKLYENPNQKYHPAPKGYQAVFINHAGRHGARHLTKDVNSTYTYQVIMSADSANGLSAGGKELKEKLLKLEKVEKKNFKSISDEGKIEQTGIAARMYENNSSVFLQNGTVLNVAYTKEIRTVQTSSAFLDELKTKINTPAINGQANDTILRFYDLSPAYLKYKKNGKWINEVDQLKKKLKYRMIAKEVSEKFFTPAYFGHLSENDRQEFISGLYGFVTIFYSVQKEITDAGFKEAEIDMHSFFSCDQLAVLNNIDNAEAYFEKGPGNNIDSIQVKIALPLLADFIRTTDEYIKNGKVNAQLRFCHAETIAPFTALLGLRSASGNSKKTTDILQYWDAAKVIPLSANVQWIFYKKSGSEKYLVKFLLNEKEVAVNGLKTAIFPYYNWTDVRSFYIKKIESFQTGLSADFYKFLLEVK